MCVSEKCDVFECDKRHPIACKYFENFRKYKHKNCAYKHENVTDMKTFDERMMTIENKLKDKQPDLKHIEKEYEKKIKGLEIQVNKMNKLVEEKNSTITDFEQKLKEQDKQTAGLLLKVENLETFAKENNKKQIKFKNNIKTLETRLTKQEKSNNLLTNKLDKICQQ